MISVYDANQTEWPTLGRILTPTSCKVVETAGGQYEATLVHPIDHEGRWTEIKVHNILKIPVPKMRIPETTLSVPATEQNRTVYKYYTTNKQTNVYKYPAGGGGTASNDATKDVSQPGDTGGSGGGSGSTLPPLVPIVTTSSSGVVLGTLPAGVKCDYGYSIEGGFVRVFVPYAEIGVGYINLNDVDYSEVVQTYGQPTDASVSTIGSHTMDDQAFRIYKTQVSSSGNTITAYARHVFYDLAYSFIGSADYSLYNSTVFSVACMRLNGRDSVTGKPSGYYGGNGQAFASANITDCAYDQNVSFKNMVSLVVDPDFGLVNKARCRLVRDNYMVYLLNNAETGDFVISYGKNLKSIRFSYDTNEAVTCVIPVSQGDTTFTCPGTNEYPLKYYNPNSSAARDSYPFERVYILDVDDVTNDESGWTKMKQEALAMFDEGCELTKLKVEIDFVNLGDTDEFKQYRNLQNVYLYDTVRIDHAPLGFADRLQVKAYEWDAILQRYNKLTLGDVFDTEIGTIPAYQFHKGSVPLSKLRKDDIAAYIRKIVEQ